MEPSNISVGSSSTKQGVGRRVNMSTKDLWGASRSGTVHDVDAALMLLKRINGNVDARNYFGSTALHIAVWRNHVPIVRRLLAAGADPDARDRESGWSSLHRALYFGHLAVAGVLIEAGASLLMEDTQGRTPVDLLSGPVKQVVDDANNSGGKEIFSWGNGANYQLGIGMAGIQKVPARIDLLHGLDVTATAAAKFHSVAMTAGGEIYSWGFGRGGRLGHPDFDIHSGQVAVISPQLVTSGLGSRHVKVIAVAKHHTIVATEGGEVFTWGSNREGQLGYPAVDTQSTPRRVSSLKAKVVAVAAANKHSAVLTESGEVFTWGCNRDGQLGYGTSNSASNYSPRALEYLKGKRLLGVSTAKYHTVVLGAEGEVFTWGYKMVMPRRVLIARNTRKGGTMPLKFHRADRLHVVAIAAGTTHSTAISEDGLVFYWVSADPHLRCYQLLPMAGHQAVAVAAGKYRTAVVTATGNVYAWDEEKTKADIPPAPFRVHGIKHATHVAVGENHSLVIASLYIPKFCHQSSLETPPVVDNLVRDSEECEEDLEMEDGFLASDLKSEVRIEAEKRTPYIPSLKDLCQRVMAQSIVEPRNALQLLEIADSLGADDLRRHCEDLVLHNLDYLLTISPMAFAQVRPTLLAEVEKALDASSSQPWSHRRLPTPTATFPAVVDSEEDEFIVGGISRTRTLSFSEANSPTADKKRASESFFRQENETDHIMLKQLRALRKKLQQIEALELRQAKGHSLDEQQLAKLQTKQAVEEALLSLDSGMIIKPRQDACRSEPVSGAAEGILTAKTCVTRRQRGSSKKKNLMAEHTQVEQLYGKKPKGGRPSKTLTKKVQDTCEVPSKEWSNDASSSLIEEMVELSIKEQLHTVEAVGSSGFSSALDEGSVTFTTSSQEQISDFVAGSSEAPPKMPGLSPAQRITKKKNKKGGLSLFLSGALDDVPKVAKQVPTPPKVDGPAWGGVPTNKGSTSLREIQSQQSAEAGCVIARGLLNKGDSSRVENFKLLGDGTEGTRNQGDMLVALVDDVETSSLRIPLTQFVRQKSVPIAVAPLKASKVVSGISSESSPPPWAGTSPLTSTSSFKDIQIQQVKHKVQQRHGGSPQLDSPIGSLGFSSGNSLPITEHGTGLVTENTSRWYKPEMASPSSIRCIQIEEKAMKELRRFYKDVKLIRSENM